MSDICPVALNPCSDLSHYPGLALHDIGSFILGATILTKQTISSKLLVSTYVIFTEQLSVGLLGKDYTS